MISGGPRGHLQERISGYIDTLPSSSAYKQAPEEWVRPIFENDPHVMYGPGFSQTFNILNDLFSLSNYDKHRLLNRFHIFEKMLPTRHWRSFDNAWQRLDLINSKLGYGEAYEVFLNFAFKDESEVETNLRDNTTWDELIRTGIVQALIYAELFKPYIGQTRINENQPLLTQEEYNTATSIFYLLGKGIYPSKVKRPHNFFLRIWGNSVLLKYVDSQLVPTKDESYEL